MIDLILANLHYVFSIPALWTVFLGSGFLGMSCLVAALNSTIKRDFKTRWTKYLMTTCCISFTSVFFLMLMIPELFVELSSYLIVTKSFLFVVVWVALAELLHYVSTLNKEKAGRAEGNLNTRLD